MSTHPVLPAFAHPPLVEVVLSVQFEPLRSLRTSQIGLLWSEYRDRFPKTEDRPPLDPVIEQFEKRRVPAVSFRVQALDTMPPSRVWFLTEDESELIQIQPDRFILNWRQGESGAIYPRYGHVFGAFKKELEIFQHFLEREKLGEVQPNQCELTYINHIVSGEGWEHHGQLDALVKLWRPQREGAFLPEPEETAIAVQYVILDDTGEPLGRLHINVTPASRRLDGKPVFVVNLTARGRPDGDEIAGVFRFLDRGHEWIVRGFDEITTPHMHEIWGRRNDDR